MLTMPTMPTDHDPTPDDPIPPETIHRAAEFIAPKMGWEISKDADAFLYCGIEYDDDELDFNDARAIAEIERKVAEDLGLLTRYHDELLGFNPDEENPPWYADIQEAHEYLQGAAMALYYQFTAQNDAKLIAAARAWGMKDDEQP